MLERSSKLFSYRFDQLADQINDRVMPDEAEVERYVGLEHLDPDSLRIRRWGDTNEVESTKLLFQPGDIIFGKRRVYQRKVAVADFEGICSAHAMVLRAKPETVLPEFLPFFMQSDLFMERALSISVGSLSPTINWKALAKEEFLLPPIQEQARIASLLIELDRTIEAMKRVEDQAVSLLVSCRESWFGISAVATTTLADLCEKGSGIQIGPFGAQLHRADYKEEGVPVIMPSDLTDNSVDACGIARIGLEKAAELAQHQVREGDILLPRRGELDRRALITGAEVGWICGTGCIRIRLDDSSLSSVVLQSLSSVSVLRWMASRAVGTTMPNLNSKIVSDIPIKISKNADRALQSIHAVNGSLGSVRQRILSLKRLRSIILPSFTE